MQRLFVMFPDRGPGIGLLWLRLCLAAALCAPGTHAGWGAVLCGLAAAMLVLGVLTPLATLMAAATMFAQQAPWPLVALPAALLMLGPGAYSVDARLFGRRLLGRRPPPFG
ncbi:hypothetical protein D7U87_14880 [Stenotrophomonas maltophilia]|jgi:hypothetical protein|uniref:Transmembrane protein n=3 Tax=Gammaproteobacteria TaxID=1236 RepID=A0AA40YH08_STEMA|nr:MULTISPECIES: hypothetical protein [Stenotrophomonas]AWB78787.1 hypothetical protein B7H26_12930 [Stenotrophomonas maltophilia]KKF87525.1 membrane protein [Stenotrophomonas maltophilia]KOO70896.1 membrane protein [Stenotrophomonas maltophilia]KOQ63169.1 membrane protein [Stenotrophomonas maltophilia]KUO99052.1 hypothetical protein AR276_11305 [Stenotrophomonas maltophilia]